MNITLNQKKGPLLSDFTLKKGPLLSDFTLKKVYFEEFYAKPKKKVHFCRISR